MTRLEDTLADLWRKHRPEAADVVPTKNDREPDFAKVGTKKASRIRRLWRRFPVFPVFPPFWRTTE